MPSRADFSRRAFETGLRALALVLLLLVLAYALGLLRRGGHESAEGADLRDALVRWSTVVAPDRVGVRLDEPLPARERDWLAALPGAGTAVAWGGASAVPVALAIEPLVDPAGGVLASIAAPAGRRVVLADELGPLDSASTDGVVTRFRVGALEGALTAQVDGSVARAVQRDSLSLRPLLVLGHAGWEAKFATAALEERGWDVNAVLAVSPKGQGDVRQGAVPPIDTARYAAVLAFDSVAGQYAEQLRRYVDLGGGVVLWSGAARTRGLGRFAAGTLGERLREEPLAPTDSAPRTKLAAIPIVNLHDDALALERRGDQILVAARRIGAGRVVHLGYQDLWRWRLHGNEHAPEAHRTWLSAVVGGVAYTPRRTLDVPRADEAPMATLVAQLGAPTAEPPAGSRPLSDWVPWIFGVFLAALFLEWASRRLRGAA